MLVAFRVDAALAIGSGHVMRCLTLAAALRAGGARCLFICRAHPGHLGELVRQQGHELQLLPAPAGDAAAAPEVPAHAAWLGSNWQDDAAQTAAALGDLEPDWLVVDHYGIDARWEQALRRHCRQLLVLDDLADRPHDADLLLDQNLGRDAADYKRLVTAGCRLLTGTTYALLRPEFAALRNSSLERRRQPMLQHILVSLGGVDLPNTTATVLAALAPLPLPADTRITVVLGLQSPWQKAVQQTASTLPWPVEVLSNISDMAARMAASDLAIGAAGSTSWERCCLGLPAILVCLAENQRGALQTLSAAGAAQAIDADAIAVQLPAALTQMGQAGTLAAFSRQAAALVDGLGTQRVRDLLYGHSR